MAQATAHPGRGGRLSAGASQVLKLEQHADDALQLAIEVHRVAGQLVEPVGLQRLAESLRPNQVAILEFAMPPAIPGQDLVFQEPLQARRVGLIGLVALGFVIVVIRVIEVFRVDLGERLRPTREGVLML